MNRYDHQSPLRAGVILVNLGTPAEASAGAIRRWLGQFLADPRVVELPRALWWPILHGVILRTRPRKLVKKYQSILLNRSMPLRAHTEALIGALRENLNQSWSAQEAASAPLIRYAMTYGEPSISSVLDELSGSCVTRFLVVPMYPQYSATTTAPIYDQCFAYLRRRRFLPEIHFVHSWHDHPAYIDGLAQTVRAHWRDRGRGDHLLISFHGLPVRNIQKGDPYFCQSHATARLLRERLAVADARCSMSFQSRFGAQKWLQPYTSERIEALARAGVKTLDVVCPGFTCDCLETLDEIAIEGAGDFRRFGGQELRLIPCMNASAQNVRLYTELIAAHRRWLISEKPDGAGLERRLELCRQRARDLGLPDTGASE